MSRFSLVWKVYKVYLKEIPRRYFARRSVTRTINGKKLTGIYSNIKKLKKGYKADFEVCNCGCND